MSKPLTPNLAFRIGADIVAVARLARLEDENPAILDSLFTGRELAYCRGKRRCHEHMAARFAAKEAVLKAFGTGIGPGMQLADVEIVNAANGRPTVVLHGAVAALAEERRLKQLDVSLSHSAGLAIAQAIAVWEIQADADRQVPRVL